MDATDAIGDRNDGPLGSHLGAHVEVLDLALDEFADFGWIQLHGVLALQRRRRRRTVVSISGSQMGRHRLQFAPHRSIDDGVADDDGRA
ncbi:MAG TPA: hypothetical protein VGO00_28645, partial [Kofleriaceae bacterium]|nr:hypothetical protein [Kofleriaceae bacterium]